MKYRICTDKALEHYEYDPITGVIYQYGVPAPTNEGKYVMVSVEGLNILAHRLAWRLHTGSWPEDQIDHEDTNKKNNRWCNLRSATNSQNGANKKRYSNNSTGYKGVTPYKGERFRAQIKHAGKVQHIGVFDDPISASAAYLERAKLLHGEFARSI